MTVGFPHLYTQLLAHYVTFAKNLIGNHAFEVRFLAQISIGDFRTVIGRSCYNISKLCNVSNDLTSLSSGLVKRHVIYSSIPECEKWRIGIIGDMKNILDKTASNSGLHEDDAQDILQFVCES